MLNEKPTETLATKEAASKPIGGTFTLVRQIRLEDGSIGNASKTLPFDASQEDIDKAVETL